MSDNEELKELVAEFRRFMRLFQRDVRPAPPEPRIREEPSRDDRWATQKLKPLTNETHNQWLNRCALLDEKEGRCITMNSLARSIPPRRPPRRPSWSLLDD